MVRSLSLLKIRHICEYLLFEMLVFFIRFCGIFVFKTIIVLLLILLFPILYKKIFSRYRLAKYNLSIIGVKNPSPLKMFFSMLQYIETFTMLTVYGSKLLEQNKKFHFIEENPDIITNLKKNNEGFIIVSFHYGNWEMFPIYLKQRFDVNNHFIYKQQKNYLIDDRIRNTRSGVHGGVYPLRKGAKDIVTIPEVVKKGEAIDILIDQIQHIGSEPINLFNKSVKIGFTIQKIAAKHNIKLVPTFCYIDKSVDKKRYKIVFHEPISFQDVDKNNINQKTQEATQKIVDIAMQHILKDPYQWFCLFYKIFGEIPSDFK